MKPIDCFNHVKPMLNNLKSLKSLSKVQMTVNQEKIMLTEISSSVKQKESVDVTVTESKKHFPNIFNKKKRSGDKSVTVFLPSQVETNVIPINKIVYCNTIPNRSNSVILVWKHQKELLCRVYVFSSVLKSFEFKHQLAMRFERSFRAWQFQFCRQSFTKYSRKAKKKISRVNFCTPKSSKRQLMKKASSPY